MENPPDAGSTVAVWQQKLDEHRNPLSDSKPVKIGQYDKTDIKAGKNWVYLEYLEGEKYNFHCNGEKRKAVILITCDPEATDNTNPLEIIEESKNRTEGCYYLFELAHPEVCEVKTE
ncbi:hypothetical protein C0Q70_02423 [Pomacea canaliculata]|uniref:MRH domain-containing protein n=1 Tax=Pomacea canaliculata TaxID=400727 RepID=A0A2T7PPY2_POMCA|nr:hypothetical protein C0Q70_02423 [Pomacea canaliculata]